MRTFVCQCLCFLFFACLFVCFLFFVLLFYLVFCQELRCGAFITIVCIHILQYSNTFTQSFILLSLKLVFHTKSYYIQPLHFDRFRCDVKRQAVLNITLILPSTGHENNIAKPKADKCLSSTSNFSPFNFILSVVL